MRGEGEMVIFFFNRDRALQRLKYWRSVAQQCE